MRVHVLVDFRHDVVAYVPVTDTWPRVILVPLDSTHTVYEHVEVPDALAALTGEDAFAVVREHAMRHVRTLPSD